MSGRQLAKRAGFKRSRRMFRTLNGDTVYWHRNYYCSLVRCAGCSEWEARTPAPNGQLLRIVAPTLTAAVVAAQLNGWTEK